MSTKLLYQARRGFNMMEVLVALGIFALGFTAIASLFPAGALLQRRTATDIQGRHVKRSTDAIVETTFPSDTELREVYFGDPAPTSDDGSFDLKPFYNSSTPTDLDDFWSLDTRSYPAAIAAPAQREFYWVPLLRDSDETNTNQSWQIVVFVLSRRDGAKYTEDDYNDSGTDPEPDPDPNPKSHAEGWANDNDDPDNVPGVREFTVDTTATTGSTFVLLSPDGIEARVNDWLVDSNGNTYRVANVISTTEIEVRNPIINGPNGNKPDAIWFAPPPDDDNVTIENSDISPAVQVFRIIDPTN